MTVSEKHQEKSVASDFDRPPAEWTRRLRALPGIDQECVFESEVWLLDDGGCTRTINWRCLQALDNDHSYLRTSLVISIVDYAKKLLISMAEEHVTRNYKLTSRSSSCVLRQFEQILLVLWFCEKHRCRTVANDAIEDLLRFAAFHRICNSTPTFPFRVSHAPLAYSTLCRRISEKRWLRVTEGQRGWPRLGFFVRLSRQKVEITMRQTVEDFYDGELTWGDYKRGQSLESLGLDCGQYYVAHCMELVRRYSGVATALAGVLDKIPKIARSLAVVERTVEYNIYAIASGCTRRRAGLHPDKYASLAATVDAALVDGGLSGGTAALLSRLSENPTAFSYSGSSRLVLPKRFLSLIVAAATVSFVALAGWRRSEFGFSMSDVTDERNNDPLSQKSTPTRYFVNWYVPKTHGSLVQTREITESQKGYLDLIQTLNRASDTDPCLLPRTRKSVANSMPFVLGLAWEDFVENGEIPSALKGRLRLELPYWKLERRFSSICSAVRNGNYQSLPEEERRLVETLVDADTKLMLRGGNPRAAKNLVGKCGESTRKIGLLRPTPHSFRHMWAEALLRRFDGDVGWMIRSNFVHMGERFWRSYVREKSTRFIAHAAQQRVVSNLLFEALTNNGSNYSGPVLKMVRRLFSKTVVANAEDLTVFAESHVESFNPTPWGYCLVRKSARNRAKCADEGIPQTQNASPLFCLGCPNFITSRDRGSELLFIANTHAEIAKNDRVPKAYRKLSGDAVKHALSHLSTLEITLPDDLRASLDKLKSTGAKPC